MSKQKPKSASVEIWGIVDAEVEKQLKKIPELVQKAVAGAVYSLLGLEPRWGRGSSIEVSVDHGNGRWSMLSEIIKAEAAKDVAEMVKDIKIKYSLEQFAAAFKQEYINAVKTEIAWRAKDKAGKMAEQDVFRLVESRLLKLTKIKIEK